MSRALKVGFALGAAAMGGKLVWERPWRTVVPPSGRLDAWVPGAQFRDTIALPGVRATAGEIFQAAEAVTLGEMPLATWVGTLRYLPGRLTGAATAPVPERPFFDMLLQDSGNIVLERIPGVELVIGAIGRLHNVQDQQFVPLADPAAFLAFNQADHEKLAMSLRVIDSEDPAAGLTLALEHRTLALDETARQRFALYWLGIKPGGAFVTGQLLAAIRRRAEALHAAAGGQE